MLFLGLVELIDDCRNTVRATAIDSNVTVRVRTLCREDWKCYVTRLGTPRERGEKNGDFRRPKGGDFLDDVFRLIT